MRCQNCGFCCRETEMLLSNEDIKRLEKKGYRKKSFLHIDKMGYAQLRNRNGYCVFYDLKMRQCSVYEDKPEGCGVYPVVFDEEKGVVIDDICNAKDSITVEEKQEKGKEVIALLHRIDEQARVRSSN